MLLTLLHDTIQSLKQAVRETPSDLDLRLVLADALEEAGDEVGVAYQKWRVQAERNLIEGNYFDKRFWELVGTLEHRLPKRWCLTSDAWGELPEEFIRVYGAWYHYYDTIEEAEKGLEAAWIGVYTNRVYT